MFIQYRFNGYFRITYVMLAGDVFLFLSFIVPVYNTEKYIDECLKSLLNQDIPNTDYEIICINDGSKDKSLERLNYFKKNILI